MFSAELERLRKSYNSHKTKSISWRRDQIRAMMRLINENRDAIGNALKKDLNKSQMDMELMELMCVHNDIVDTLDNLEERMKPDKCRKSLLSVMNTVEVRKEPFGVVLVIGAWNFPFMLTLQPLVGAIAAGNCAVIKPSELAPESGALIKQLVERYLDPDCFSVVIAGPKESSDLINNHRFDLIFYTGGSYVGKLIMQAAAKHLTPVILELGGKNPCYVDKSCDLECAAKRIAWGKWSNAGQACVAPDFILCEQTMREPLIGKIKEKIREMYGDDPKNSESYGRIVNERHVKRLRALLEGVEIVYGGDIDEGDRYFAPTIVTNVTENAAIKKEEIFGPILPIYVVKDVDEAISMMNDGEKSLQLSVFARDRKVIDKVTSKTSSGGITVNDLLIQHGELDLPFGGVGDSGIGNYHGKYSFDTFSQKRSVYESFTPEVMNAVRYPPYSHRQLSVLRPLVFKSGPMPKPVWLLLKFAFIAGAGVLMAYLYMFATKSK